jgi:D-cysteine desulfhydrase
LEIIHNCIVDDVEYKGRPLKIIRDDLYPFVGGGNKARKIISIASKVELEKCNAVVTTGGIQSNHCRAVSVMAAMKKWKCKLILHGDRRRFFEETGNAKIIRLSGVEVEFAEPQEIGTQMDAAMKDFCDQGYRPYYIYGGGHDMSGGKAYVNAVKDLSAYFKSENWFPDYIFLASGTGSTQGGILAGLDLAGMSAKVYGISIARNRINAESIVRKFYLELKSELLIEGNHREVIVLDEFLAGGYESANQEIQNTVKDIAKETGILTDPTYTGKAFWGMMETIKKEQLSGQILFWHTGGINNLMSSTVI